ncbi:MAG: hypothetical protein APF81_19780 [Desulfosporosinus sp. BRH_c37]|nr:MAG: hypothetical protein APF81_19780 [Desulfosporosinus sp. BRH_c37]
MSKIEITFKSDELILALIRLAEALENKQRSVDVDEPDEVVEKEEPPIAPEQPEDIKPPAKNEKPVTLEQIRAVLTAKSQAGKKAAIQGLFKKYNADKLTAVDPMRYADLFKEAEAL